VRLVVSLVILSTVFASTEWAQFTTARPTGSVLDPSGSADVGASVEVRQVNMGYRQSKQTAVSDEYVFQRKANHGGLHKKMEQLVFKKMRLPAYRFEVAALHKQG
jgi:hypothetical protein